MKKILLALTIVAVIALAVGSIAYTGSPNNMLGMQIKKAKEDPSGNRVIARVNGQPITKQRYQERLATQSLAYKQLGKSAPTKQELINALAKSILLQEEATRRGIKVSDAEVQEFLEKQKAAIESMPDENKQVYTEMLQGMGMTEEQYWSSKETFDAYKKALYVAKFRGQFRKDANTPEEYKKAEERCSAFIEDMLKNAKIEILE